MRRGCKPFLLSFHSFLSGPLDPAVYPYSLQTIYPSVALSSTSPTKKVDPGAYPYNLQAIYPPVTLSISISVKTAVVEKPSPILASKVASGHVRKPSWKRGLPPVPPMPKNVHTMTPFSAVSGKPLPPARMIRIPVQLTAKYPNISPCMFASGGRRRMLTFLPPFLDPAVYPNFDLYPAVAAAEDLSNITVELRGKEPSVSQYPHLVICE